MDKQSIMNEIDALVMSESHKDYKLWTIGVTDDPDTRKDKHKSDGKNVVWWKAWQTDSEDDGRAIEDYYLKKKGMKGGPGGPGTADYVYIF